jgi:Nucleoside-diphosphate-sugar pyrophosphorylase involved in lipopolysaccharide biosynthesis/translation initiation factor 2B, gamma/epsilon subunits (eIF-2Bgamma/eIF-2Bepsilon)
MRALILAGGFGKRLAPLTNEVPKPLLPVAGKPILVRQIEWLRGQGFSDLGIL